MLIGLFDALRAATLPVSLRELLDLHAALDARLVFADVDAFYRLAKLVFVKDERHYDRFDRGFANWINAVESAKTPLDALIPEDWLRQDFLRRLSDEEKLKLEALGGLEKLMEAFRKRLEEQTGRHAGGNRWIGTGGTSPFGVGGYHPEGIRVGPNGGNRSGVKVWEQRNFRDLDDSVALGSRNIQLALRRLRRFARQGAADEFDIDGTIKATARDAGLLNVRMRPERHNAIKVILLLDVGGSMDDHVRVCEELFSAARSEFKRLHHYYFHNCVYEHLWTNNRQRYSERVPTNEVLRRYGADHKLIVVGDAAMAPYEISHPGGSVEHDNAEPGALWLQRLAAKFPHLAWINPNPRPAWDYTTSTRMIRELVDERMFELSPAGLDAAMRRLLR